MTREDMAVCPHCGGDIKKTATACPHCGSDGETGWSSDTYLDGIDMPDEASYEEICRNEFGKGSRRPWSYRRWVVVTALIVLAVFIAALLSTLR